MPFPGVGDQGFADRAVDGDKLGRIPQAQLVISSSGQVPAMVGLTGERTISADLRSGSMCLPRNAPS